MNNEYSTPGGSCRATAWKLGAQAVAVTCLLAAEMALAQGPAPAQAPNLHWSRLACSADARVLVAAANGLGGGYLPSLVYVSTNGGLGWSAAPLPGCIWGSVACNDDGTCLAAAVHDHALSQSGDGPVYVSTDAGQTWVQSAAPIRQWTALAFPGSGTRLLAAGYDGYYGLEVVYASPDLGQTWSLSFSRQGFEPLLQIASSSDGARLVATSGWPGGSVYTSTNSGVAWTASTISGSFSADCVAISADGMQMVAVDPDTVWASQDGGADWVQTWDAFQGTPPAQMSLVSITMSADGSRLVGVDNSAQVYASSDLGSNWIKSWGPAEHLDAICGSRDGTRLATAEFGGGIYVSTNSGSGWVNVSEPLVLGLPTSAPAANWRAIACSADGTNLVACESPAAALDSGQIYVSHNRGADWTLTSAPLGRWTALASSADGAKLVAVAGDVRGLVNNETYYSGVIISSADFGQSWTQTSAPVAPWCSVACSTNGDRLLAATWDGAVYVSSDAAATWTLTSPPIYLGAAVAISADGLRLAVAPADGPICISTNAGGAWTTAGLKNPPDWTPWSTNLSLVYWWYALGMSADGSELAVGANDCMFLSADGGATWCQAAVPAAPQSFAFSADGTRLAVAGFALSLSADGGATWTEAAFTNLISAAAISADGTKLAGLASSSGARDKDDNGGIFVAQTIPFAPAPRLDVVPSWTVAQTNGVASSNACVTLTWQLAQSGYALQVNPGLDPAGWADVNWGTEGLVSLDMNHDADNQAVFSNLGPQRFFRLKKQ